MRYNFCTLFDKNYLYRGLALCNSLLQHCSDFKLWILCMDDVTYGVLSKMKLDNVELISLAEFETPELLKAKENRTAGEYCWTYTSSLLLFILKNNPELDTIAYLDADLFFFSDPAAVYQEFGQRAVMLIPHRYPREKRFLEKQIGVYNVGMVIFRNNVQGLAALEWWQARCLEWCFNRSENGKFGDQAYLNDWPQRFSGVYVLQHKGANLAPWNMNNYKIKPLENRVFVENVPLIFFHFHSLKIFSPSSFDLVDVDYPIKQYVLKTIYQPYLVALKAAISEVKKISPGFNFGFSQKPGFKKLLKIKIKKTLKSIPYLYSIWYWLKRNFSEKQ